MKNHFLKYCGIGLLMIATKSFAYDVSDSFEVAKNKLLKTDCALSINECRYYAAVEHVVLAKTCINVIFNKFEGTKTKKELDEYNQKVDLEIEKWKAIEDPEMHKAVLSKNNLFKDKVEEVTTEYLSGLTIDEVGIECSSYYVILNNKNPENYSRFIRKTLNYDEWYKPIQEKIDKEFQENQMKLVNKN
jgi:hypothetical protein